MCNFLPCHPLYRSFSRLQVTVHGGYGSVEQIFLSILFLKKLGFGSEWVWFGSVWKMWFRSDVMVIYYLYEGKMDLYST